jgi:hypothetical protein
MGLTQNPTAATNGVQLRYTLTSSGTLTIPGASTAAPITATVVCIGGGAGGSPNYGASYIGYNINGNATTYGNVCGGGWGGNAGNASVGQVLIAGPVTYIIGAGGTGSTASNNNTNYLNFGNSGGNSVFANLIGIGGQGIGNIQTAYLLPFNMGTFLGGSKVSFSNIVPSTGSIFGKGFNADGSYGGGYSYYNSSGTDIYTGISSRQSTGSHAGGGTGMGCNSTTSGGPTTAGSAGEAGGTGGGGTAGLANITGPSTLNGGSSSSTSAYTIANGTNIFVGGGGGGGGSGRTDGGTAQLGGAGGAASQYGGTGGTGGSGVSVSGSGTASGNNGGNATGYGAGGGGGGGGAAGPNSPTSNNAAGGVVTGNGGNGSQGVILVFY